MTPTCQLHTERAIKPSGKTECLGCRRSSDRERKPWRVVHALYLELLTQRGITMEDMK